MKSSDELKTEIREHNQVLASHTPRATNPPPFPTRAVAGYKWGEATDTAIEHAQILWNHHHAVPDNVLRAARLKAAAESRLAEVEEREAADAQARTDAEAALEARVRGTYFSHAWATEENWKANRAELLKQAQIEGRDPQDQIRRELLQTGRYQRF